MAELAEQKRSDHAAGAQKTFAQRIQRNVSAACVLH